MGGGRGRVDTRDSVKESLDGPPVLKLLGLVGLALAIRVGAWAITEPTGPAGDEGDWLLRAARIARGDPWPDDGARAPGLIFFYVVAFKVAGISIGVAKCANVLVSALTVWPVYEIGRRLGGGRVGSAAALAVAFYPTFIAFSHFLWPAPLYIFLLATGVAALLVGVEKEGRERGLWLAGAGVFLGLSALVKESGLGFPVAAAFWVVWRCRRDRLGGWISGLWVAGLATLVLLPWVMSLQRPDQPFALVTRTGYMNLYVGNHPHGHGVGMREYPGLGATPREAQAIARDRAFSWIQSRGLAWPWEKVVKELPRFFTPTSFAIRRLLAEPDSPGGWRYHLVPAWIDFPWIRGAMVASVVVSYLAALVLGSMGLILAQRREVVTLFGLFIATQLLPSIVMFSMSRFRLATMTFLLIGAGQFLVRGRLDWSGASPLRRNVAAGTALILLGLAAIDASAVLESTGR